MTAAWATAPLLALDTETTGVDPWTDRIVEIATVLVHPDSTTSDTFHRIVNPGCDIPDGAAAIHGITTERAIAEGKTPMLVLRGLLQRLENHDGPVVIYNARFDWPLIVAECERHGITPPATPQIIDPMVIERHLHTIYKAGAYKLITVAGRYNVPLDEADAHGALADATASGRIVWAQAAANPAMADCGLDQLVVWQVRWAEAQRADLEDYMRRRRDPKFTAPTGWPIPERTAA